MGFAVPLPPNPDASSIEALHKLWKGAGLELIETRAITVQRTFANIDDYWKTILGGPNVGTILKALTSEEAMLKTRLRARLPVTAGGEITNSAWVNAIKGHVPN
jgi:hypothetical protein